MGYDVTLQSVLRRLDGAGASRRRILVTGAGGTIGRYFVEHAPDRYDLRLLTRDAEEAEPVRDRGEVVHADITDLGAMKQACEGIDTVLHLAASPSPTATWDELLPANIVGTYNTFVAAKSAGCRRVIYASSVHAVSGYPADAQVKPHEPVNPGDLYGVTKCFGEALARYMAEQEGLSAIAVRIAAFQPHESARDERRGISMLDAWVSRRDLQQLLCRCIDDESIRFAIFHGLSDNRFKKLDITNARELLGYAPQDDATKEHPDLAELDLAERVTAHSLADGAKSGLREDL